MALIHCPECGKEISDRAAIQSVDQKSDEDYKLSKSLTSAMIGFEQDMNDLFQQMKYIPSQDAQNFLQRYGRYYDLVTSDRASESHASYGDGSRSAHLEVRRFTDLFATFNEKVDTHNESYILRELEEHKGYFDEMLKSLDQNIMLDEEQRRAIVTDDHYCLLVAGAGSGKTTTMTAKVKYLVEKKGVAPEDIIVISYTNKAINELKERINKGLKIAAEVCTFHKFAYNIVKKFTDQPPEVNFSAYMIIFDMLDKSIYQNKRLMRNLVLLMGYYFDLTEDVFKFENLSEYHRYKAIQDHK